MLRKLNQFKNRIGGFAFGINVIKHDDGSLSYYTKTENNKVPVELVILQMKSYLKDLEDKYFNDFKSNHSKT